VVRGHARLVRRFSYIVRRQRRLAMRTHQRSEFNDGASKLFCWGMALVLTAEGRAAKEEQLLPRIVGLFRFPRVTEVRR
jgi:hypothetical protein